MTFDELIGAEPTGAERERLRNVHELLLQAGPPAELSPELAAGPTLAMTLSRVRSFSRRRRSFVIAALAAAFLALIIGVGTTLHHGVRYPTLTMRGTSFASGATGTLELLPSKSTGPKSTAQQRMRLEVKGLPPLGKRRYVVYLVRNGRPVARCGSFTVANSSRTLTVKLISPYRLKGSDSWVVTAQPRTGTGPGVTVLRELT